MIYPKRHTKVYVPTEIDGSSGRVVFEAAHQNPETKVFWYLNDDYLGETRRIHQMGFYPVAGIHELSIVDETRKGDQFILRSSKSP